MTARRRSASFKLAMMGSRSATLHRVYSQPRAVGPVIPSREAPKDQVAIRHKLSKKADIMLAVRAQQQMVNRGDPPCFVVQKHAAPATAAASQLHVAIYLCATHDVACRLWYGTWHYSPLRMGQCSAAVPAHLHFINCHDARLLLWQSLVAAWFIAQDQKQYNLYAQSTVPRL